METKTKKNIYGIIRIIAFGLALVLFLHVLSTTFFSKKNAATYKNKFSYAYAYLREPKNTLDIIIIGNSDAYSAIIPTELWTGWGITSTIISTPRQNCHDSIDMMQDALKEQKPKLVIIETDMLYKLTPAEKNEIDDEEKLSKLDDFFEASNPDQFEDAVNAAFPVFTFHDKWKSLFIEKKRTPAVNSHGYNLSLWVKKIRIKDYMKETDEVEELSNKTKRDFGYLVEESKAKGAEVLLVDVPSPRSWNYERHNAVVQLAKEHNLEFIDLNLSLDEIGIDQEEDFRDKGNHLNYYGAVKLTKYFGTILNDKYEFKDKRGKKKYKSWDKSVKEFDREIEAEKIRVEKVKAYYAKLPKKIKK